MSEAICIHLENWKELKKPAKYECDECVKIGADLVHLRTCQTCGVTLCCDSSYYKHASKHAKASGHPVAISAELGEQWAWCYIDEQIIGY